MSDCKQLWRCALDSTDALVSCVFLQGDEVKFEEFYSMSGRETSRLAQILTAAAQQLGIDLNEVTEWSVGSGPGSFTGLRLVAALVEGLTLNRDTIKRRCLPGALGWAAGCHAAPGSRVGVLYDGRNKEVLYFGCVVDAKGEVQDGKSSGIYNAAQLKEFLAGNPADVLVAPEFEMPAVAKLLPEGVTVQPLAHPEIAALARHTGYAFDGDLTKLIYLRPAVFTK